jgi:hypothetical protein
MELLAGETLADTLRARGPLGFGEALSLLNQIAAGLEAAHTCGVVHRDLKSSNVFLVGRGDTTRAVITDFGLARSMSMAADVSFETRSGVVLGTPVYMAPEQLRGQEVDARADIYALGVLTYEMLTNRFPFEGRDALTVALKCLQEEPVPLRDRIATLPEHCEQALLRCLARESDARFRSPVEFVAALARPRPVGAKTRTRSRTALTLGIAAVIGTGFAGAVALQSPDDRANAISSARPPVLDAVIDGVAVPQIETASFAEAIDELVRELRARMPGGWSERVPDAEELVAMRPLGGRSFEVWRHYRAAEAFWVASHTDATGLAPARRVAAPATPLSRPAVITASAQPALDRDANAATSAVLRPVAPPPGHGEPRPRARSSSPAEKGRAAASRTRPRELEPAERGLSPDETIRFQ